MIGHLDYYHLLSKFVRLSDPHNPSQARQLFVSRIEYGQEILISHQIVRDSQWVENQASISQFIACNHKLSSLDTIRLISYNLETRKPCLILTTEMKFKILFYFEQICSYYITLLGTLNTGLRLLSFHVTTRSQEQSCYLKDNGFW